MRKNQGGFAIVEVLLVVLVVAVVGYIGYYVYSQANKKTVNNSPAVSSNPDDAFKADAEKIWKDFDDPKAVFGFSYPPDWSVLTVDEFTNESGLVDVSNSNGLSLMIKQSIGGKGGDCDPEATDKPHNTAFCPTIEILNGEIISAKSKSKEAKQKDIHLLTVKYTDGKSPTGSVPQSQYYTFLTNNEGLVSLTAPSIGGWGAGGTVYNGFEGLYIETYITGGDIFNPSIIESADFKTIQDILRSLTIK